MEDSENSQDSVGGDEFQESVVDATKRELYAFKVEAKRWSQTDNRPSAPSASADSATRTSAPHSFRNLHMYLYKYMFLFVCDWTEVFFMHPEDMSPQSTWDKWNKNKGVFRFGGTRTRGLSS